MSFDSVEISPVRSLDDFLLGSARFQIPNFKDLEKWGNRVANNLLYYQTNYFLMALAVFLLVGIMNPLKFLCGMIGIGITFGIFCYFTNAQRGATQFKKDHPILGVFLILGGGYLIVYFLGSVLVFLFGILLPIGLIFIHSSMRLRNIKNKIINKMELTGLKKTPMGMLLEALEGERTVPLDSTKLITDFKAEKTILGLYNLKATPTNRILGTFKDEGLHHRI